MQTKLAALGVMAAIGLQTTRAMGANNADVYLMVELPSLHTPIARWDAAQDNVTPLDIGLRTSFGFPTERSWQAYFGHTIRGGRTAMDTRAARLRLDAGWRRVFEPREQGRPFVELGTGFETLWFAAPGAGEIYSGAGPTAGVGLLFDEDHHRGLIGLRMTTALMGGGYQAEDPTEGRAYRFQPSNVGLALYVGQVF